MGEVIPMTGSNADDDVPELTNERSSEPRFGLCPECGFTDGYVNVGRSHWFLCDVHKTRWIGGANIFSSWRDESEEDWERNVDKLSGYRRVDPLWRDDA